jgi:hypothetical protein
VASAVHGSARSAGRRLNAAREEFLSITPARFLRNGTFERALGVFVENFLYGI